MMVGYIMKGLSETVDVESFGVRTGAGNAVE